MAKPTVSALSLVLSLSLGSVGFLPGLISSAKAQTQQAQTQAQSQAQTQTQTQAQLRGNQFGGFFAPQGKAAPRNTKGGASRGRCLQDLSQDNQAVQLLTPESNLGLTTSARPVFMAHVDQSAAEQVFFSLKNEDESYFYEMTMTLPQQSAGIIQFQLPDNAPPLQVGEQYLWSVALVCGTKLGPNSPWASGWVERVESTVSPESASPAELATHYGREGIWFDTAEALSQWKQGQTNAEATVAWQALLSSQGLGQLSNAAIIAR